ncbi:hypothetical protein BSPWISOXPB_3586 [uncultured Gammaproteobacteria bacterium]|nr:hypothetical protein BSPWISOXPB_3586 [uncultured Gammaproteobacteria bacterium]
MIYTVTAIGRRGQDTATVVIAVGVGTTNLALRKHATQSSTYIHAVFTVAGYAVDGNTNGKLSNRSIAITEHEQGAWWQVDLGGQKISSKLLSTTALIAV